MTYYCILWMLSSSRLAHAFVNRQPSSGARTRTTASRRRATFVSPFISSSSSSSALKVLYDDFEDFAFLPNNNSNKDSNPKHGGEKMDDETTDLYAALRARQADFKTSSSSFVHIDDYGRNGDLYDDNSDEESILSEMDEETYCLDNWRDATCTSTVRLTLDDWIRRIAIDTYPLAAVGTASGHLYLADLQEGEELDCIMNVHLSHADALDDDDDEQGSLPPHLSDAMRDLFGQFDGGGVVALAMKDDWIVSTGREGGAHLCRIVGQEQNVYKGSRGGTSKQTKLSMHRLGRFRGLNKDVVITSVVFDTIGSLWLGGYDGVLRAYDYEERDDGDQPCMLRQSNPSITVDLGSAIVNLSVNDELGCGVASTVGDGVVIFSLEDGEILAKWNPLVKKVRKEFVRSAMLLKDESNPNEDEPPRWSVFCGGSRGSLFQRFLNVDRTDVLSDSKPFLDQVTKDDSIFPVKMRPNHMGPIVALASPAPGLLVSGAQDGSMRVWDYAVYSNDDYDDEEEDVDDEDEDQNEEDVEEEDDDEEDQSEIEAQYDDIQPNDTRPQCLYALSGYKVWLGSIFATSRKLVSDGADNTIIVHSFEDEEEFLFSEDDDDDDMEGTSLE